MYSLKELTEIVCWNIKNNSRPNSKEHFLYNILLRTLLNIKKYILTNNSEYINKTSYNLYVFDSYLKYNNYSEEIMGYKNIYDFYEKYVFAELTREIKKMNLKKCFLDI